MPLIQLWETSPDIVLQYSIKQIVSAAGNGVLTDGSECSGELRHYLRNIPENKLFRHVEDCLSDGFDKSGSVLQDIVNELGRRLDYEVEDGLYQGRSNQIGNDGLWKAPDGHSLVIEVKTTDAYLINLDKIAEYRTKLIKDGRITEKSSILIVVGRNDTDGLEAQIRGSRHAWDTRIISAEALMKVVELKVNSDEDKTTEKIRNLLVPFEYTRLDNIIDVMFTTAKDAEAGADETERISDASISNDRVSSRTSSDTLAEIRQKVVGALGKQENTHFITNKRTQYWSVDKKTRAVCAVSKLYDVGHYWYGFHPPQKSFLSEAEKGFLILACSDNGRAYAVPYAILVQILPYLNTTEQEERSYWHIHLQPSEDGGCELVVPQRDNIDVKAYELAL